MFAAMPQKRQAHFAECLLFCLRRWPENQEWLEFAERVGVNVSELINEILRDNLRPRLERKVKAIREAVAAPVP
jgi:hypothetical protein